MPPPASRSRAHGKPVAGLKQKDFSASMEGKVDEAQQAAFRTVELKVAQPGVEAKTIRGYYP